MILILYRIKILRYQTCRDFITITIILALLAILFIKYKKLEDLENAIITCEENLEYQLKEKNEIIKILIKEINDEELNKFKYNEEETIHEKENALFNIRWDINKYLLENPKKNNTFKKEIIKLNEIDDNIEGLKDYYNANVINYNELFLKKPLNLIYKLLKFTQYKSFKLRKIDDYEILKNQSIEKSIGLIFFDIKNSLALEKGLLPKKQL